MPGLSGARRMIEFACFPVCAIVYKRVYENISMTTTMTLRIEPALKNRLDRLAKATHRSKSFLAAQALQDFVELNEWQVGEIQSAIKEADQGDFASPQAVRKSLNKWGVDGS